MIDLTQDIHPLTDFKSRTPEFTKRIKETGKPLILTINGKPELVVHDAASYQQYLEFLEYRDSVDQLRGSLADIAKGRTHGLKDVDGEIRRKHGIRS